MNIVFDAQAEIAQLVEHFTRNEGVVGSSPIFSFFIKKQPPVYPLAVFLLYCNIFFY